MNTSILLLALSALAHLNLGQSCPQDSNIGSPINYVHLFKEQTDIDWDFYNTKTTNSLVYQDSINLTGGATMQRIAFRITDSTLPVRQWLYLVNIRYDANAFISHIDRFAKIRSDGNTTNDTDILQIFFNDFDILLPAPGNCCLAKLEYINFYYLFAQYYKDGNGLIKPACT